MSRMKKRWKKEQPAHLDNTPVGTVDYFEEVEMWELDPAAERGERINIAIAIARGGRETGHVEGAVPGPAMNGEKNARK